MYGISIGFTKRVIVHYVHIVHKVHGLSGLRNIQLSF